MTFDLLMDIMGGAATIGRPVHHPLDFMALSREGMPVAVVRSIQERMNFTNKEISGMLDISESTLQRLFRSKSSTKKETLKKDEAEKAYHIARVIAKGIEVFEEENDFIEWLHTRNTALGEVKPIDLMNSAIGREQIEELLIRIQYGMYS
jgi:putative toxin-antitoxin system antitoxin component (TIGR02293 family)